MTKNFSLENCVVEQKTCLLLHEASSSRTTFSSFNQDLSVNPINQQQNYILDIKISDFAQSKDPKSYYDAITRDLVIQDHLTNSHCDLFHWVILSTGGMRSLEDIFSKNYNEYFYSSLKEHFLDYISFSKKVILKDARTISADEEGIYAWRSHASFSNNDDDYIVFDLGGATGQITDQSGLIYTEYLGKEKIKNDIGIHNLVSCFNNKFKDQYQGSQCREVVESHITLKFRKSLPQIQGDSVTFFGISNFYNFLNDLCKTYLPFIQYESLKINPDILSLIDNLCQVKKYHNNTPIVIQVSDYKYIGDEVCRYWGNWLDTTSSFAADMCFSVNYSYLLLKAIGFKDDAAIYISGKDWSEGAALSYF